MNVDLSILRFRAPYPDDGRIIERVAALIDATAPAMHPAVGAWCRREMSLLRGAKVRMRQTGDGMATDDVIDRIIAMVIANNGVVYRDGDWYVGEPEPQVDRPNVIDTMRAEIDALRASVVASDVRMLGSDIDGLSRRVEHLAAQIDEMSKARGLDYRLNLYFDAEGDEDVSFRDGDWHVGEPKPQVDRPNIIDTMRAEIDALKQQVAQCAHTKRLSAIEARTDDLAEHIGALYRIEVYRQQPDDDPDEQPYWVGDLNIILADPTILDRGAGATTINTTAGKLFISSAEKLGPKHYKVIASYEDDAVIYDEPDPD